MDLVTLFYTFVLAFGGVALDAYENPKTMVVQVVAPGGGTVPSLAPAFIDAVVTYELDRMSGIHSLIARPHIRPSSDKTKIQMIASALGGEALTIALSELLVRTPNNLKIGLFTEGNKPAVLVAGNQRAIPALHAQFEAVMRQEPEEPVVDLIKRSVVDGAAQIDPYLAAMYLMTEAHRTGNERYAAHALDIFNRMATELPPGRSALLARLHNVQGLIQLNRGDLPAAYEAFLRGLDRRPADNTGPTLCILHLNLAFIEIALGHPAAADERVAMLLEPGSGLDARTILTAVTTEGAEIRLSDEEMRFLRSTAYMLRGAAALARDDSATAERMARESLEIDPTRLSAIALQADIATRRGDAATASQLNATIQELQFHAQPYKETANAYARLSLADATVKIVRRHYITQ
jgi:tetratricopeptide (TPR) repeat protein